MDAVATALIQNQENSDKWMQMKLQENSDTVHKKSYDKTLHTAIFNF
jgi:hypothetical protein